MTPAIVIIFLGALLIGAAIGYLVMPWASFRRSRPLPAATVPRLASKSTSTDLAPANPDLFDARYIQDASAGRAGIVFKHLDGVAWHDVEPLPPRHHRCWVQSWGFLDSKTVRRCACGATSMDDIFVMDGQLHWMNKNETLNGRERNQRAEG